jgi:hypothetical protein
VIEFSEVAASQARRWPPVLWILVTLLIAAALIVLGFVLGWILFR